MDVLRRRILSVYSPRQQFLEPPQEWTLVDQTAFVDGFNLRADVVNDDEDDSQTAAAVAFAPIANKVPVTQRYSKVKIAGIPLTAIFVSRNTQYEHTNRKTRESQQYTCIPKANYSLKVHNMYFRLGSSAALEITLLRQSSFVKIN